MTANWTFFQDLTFWVMKVKNLTNSHFKFSRSDFHLFLYKHFSLSYTALFPLCFCYLKFLSQTSFCFIRCVLLIIPATPLSIVLILHESSYECNVQNILNIPDSHITLTLFPLLELCHLIYCWAEFRGFNFFFFLIVTSHLKAEITVSF